MKSPLRSNSGSYKNLLLICLTALILSTGASWFFYHKWEAASDNYSSLLSQQYESSRQLLQIQDELNRIHPDLEVMRDTEYDVYTLYSSNPEMPGGICRIYWNPVKGEALLDAGELTPTEEGMVYRVDYQKDGKTSAFKKLSDPLNHDQLLPLGNVTGVTRWVIAYGPETSPEAAAFMEVASSR